MKATRNKVDSSPNPERTPRNLHLASMSPSPVDPESRFLVVVTGASWVEYARRLIELLGDRTDVIVIFFFKQKTAYEIGLGIPAEPLFRSVDCWRKMRKFDLSLRSSRSSYFATFRHQLTILSKTDALDEEKWLNMLGTFVKDWFRYESHFVHGRDSLVDILKERGLLSESDAVQPLIGKKS